ASDAVELLCAGALARTAAARPHDRASPEGLGRAALAAASFDLHALEVVLLFGPPALLAGVFREAIDTSAGGPVAEHGRDDLPPVAQLNAGVEAIIVPGGNAAGVPFGGCREAQLHRQLAAGRVDAHSVERVV